MARLLLIAASVIVLFSWRPDPLYGPLALISGLGVLTMLTLANSLLAVIMLRRQGQINRLGLPLLIGATLTIAEIAAINLLRAMLIGL